MFTKIHSACDYFGKIFILSFCLIHFCAYSHAGTAHPKPSLKQTSQHLPENISLKKAHLLKLKYEGELGNTTNTSINEESFLSALLAYDNIRLEISEILLELVAEYQLSGDFAKKLTGFSHTFSTHVKDAQGQISNLAEYKAYSNTFALTYAALVYALHDDKSFYSRYSTDLKDPTSILGDYKQRLDIAYASLSEKHISYLDFNKKSQLENKISALEHLINSRKLAQQSTSELP